PYATSTEVKQAILTTTEKKPAFGSVTVTGGRLDANKALNSNIFAPRASLVSIANPTVTVAGGADNLITVKYHDRVGINAATIGDGDIIAARQWGPADTITATYVANSKSITNNGTDVSAQYRIAAPNGSWDAQDFGGYVLSVVAGEVKNFTGLAVATDSLGQ